MRTRGRRGLENVFEFPKNNEIARSRSTSIVRFREKRTFFREKRTLFRDPPPPRTERLDDWMTG